MLTVHFIRHGQSEGNIQTDTIGGLEPHVQLTELGVAQARELHEWLKEQDHDVIKVCVSSLDRALDTAQIATKYLEQTHHVDKRLVEGTHGEWEGKPKSIFEAAATEREQLGEAWKAPGGESITEVRARMREAFDELVAPYAHEDKHVYVFGHGGSIRCLVGDLLGVDGFLYKSALDNTGRVEMQYVNGDWKMIRFNDTSHLHGAAIK